MSCVRGARIGWPPFASIHGLSLPLPAASDGCCWLGVQIAACTRTLLRLLLVRGLLLAVTWLHELARSDICDRR
jgi:hypothetical protein